ncbi:UNVERIFIED_CONTAM: hypothetical protein K2H54_051980 [Gekko kuhli]
MRSPRQGSAGPAPAASSDERHAVLASTCTDTLGQPVTSVPARPEATVMLPLAWVVACLGRVPGMPSAAWEGGMRAVETTAGDPISPPRLTIQPFGGVEGEPRALER